MGGKASQQQRKFSDKRFCGIQTAGSNGTETANSRKELGERELAREEAAALDLGILLL